MIWHWWNYIWAETSAAELVTAPKWAATVILPSKDVKTRVFRDGASLDLGYATHACDA